MCHKKEKALPTQSVVPCIIRCIPVWEMVKYLKSRLFTVSEIQLVRLSCSTEITHNMGHRNSHTAILTWSRSLVQLCLHGHSETQVSPHLFAFSANSLRRWSSGVSVHQCHLNGSLKHRRLSPTWNFLFYKAWLGAWEFEFLTSYQVKLMLLVRDHTLGITVLGVAKGLNSNIKGMEFLFQTRLLRASE